MEEKDLLQEENSDLIDIPQKRDYEDELLKIIQTETDPEKLRQKLDDYHDNDIASVFHELTETERRRIYKALNDDEVSDIFSYLDDVEDYVKELDTDKVADILESMDADDAVDVLNELQEDTKQEIIDKMDEESAKDIKLIDSYDDDTVGSRMTTNYVYVRKGSSVKDAMKSVVAQAAENDNISTIFALTDDDEYYGIIDLRDLVIARQTTPLEEIISTSYPYLYATETIAECLEQLKDYSEDSIPVLDKNNKLIGIITSSDIVEVVDEEFKEDYAKLGGLSEEEDLNEKVYKSVTKRVPWLIALFGMAFCVSLLVGAFDGVIEKLAYLVFFQSMILGMSGNVGTQSLAVTIRVLSGDDVDRKTQIRLVFKELKVGITEGLIMGLLSFLAVGIYLNISMPTSQSFLSSGCIGIALFAAITFSSLTGTIIPIVFKKIKIDPAVASGPLITTFNDMVAVCTYYGLAFLMLFSIA